MKEHIHHAAEVINKIFRPENIPASIIYGIPKKGRVLETSRGSWSLTSSPRSLQSGFPSPSHSETFGSSRWKWELSWTTTARQPPGQHLVSVPAQEKLPWWQFNQPCELWLLETLSLGELRGGDWQVENNALWFLKHIHCEAKGKYIYSDQIWDGSSSKLVMLATFLMFGDWPKRYDIILTRWSTCICWSPKETGPLKLAPHTDWPAAGGVQLVFINIYSFHLFGHVNTKNVRPYCPLKISDPVNGERRDHFV